MSRFVHLGISEELSQVLTNFNIIQPTAVQEKSIPFLLDGDDAIIQAQTGTGKTFAFLLPILEKIIREREYIQALIIAPTRELAIQITQETDKLLKEWKGINALAIYGGQDVEQQLKKLKGATHIVIGTPGRLLDHMRRGSIDISQLKMLVLDEADQMLHIGFLTEVRKIISYTPSTRQTMLFSATMTFQVKQLASQFMSNPKEIHMEKEIKTLDQIHQVIYQTTDRAKQNTFIKLLQKYSPQLVIVFCRTKRRANKLYEALFQQRYIVELIHGDISQAKREEVMHRFREGLVHILVATDVAARGLDIEGVDVVFNYDIPHDIESYIHRIGRTGRAGESGIAITLVAPKDKNYLQLIERVIGPIHLEKLP